MSTRTVSTSLGLRRVTLPVCVCTCCQIIRSKGFWTLLVKVNILFLYYHCKQLTIQFQLNSLKTIISH